MAGVPSSHSSRGRSRHHLMHDGGRCLALGPMHITARRKEQTLWADSFIIRSAAGPKFDDVLEEHSRPKSINGHSTPKGMYAEGRRASTSTSCRRAFVPEDINEHQMPKGTYAEGHQTHSMPKGIHAERHR